jgi:hypothetical protein
VCIEGSLCCTQRSLALCSAVTAYELVVYFRKQINTDTGVVFTVPGSAKAILLTQARKH